MVKPSDTLKKFATDLNAFFSSAVYLTPEGEYSLKLKAPLLRVGNQIKLTAVPVEALPTVESHLHIEFPIQIQSEVVTHSALNITDLLSRFQLELNAIAPAKSLSVSALQKKLDEIETALAAGQVLADEIESILNTQA